MTHDTVRAAVIGGGPAGLMAATVLAEAGCPPVVFDAMPSPGRKLLMAGRGGLNLTHTEARPGFDARYGAAAPEVGRWLDRFGPEALRGWCADLGIETFVGTSGRVFPVGLKASPLLRAWLRRLAARGVEVRARHRWTGFAPDGALQFQGGDGDSVAVRAGATVLALGGASWPRLGSDGGWAEILAGRGVTLAPFRPANCGFEVPWSDGFSARWHGAPVKNLALAFAGRTARGDLVLTRRGIEGGAVYALAAPLRDAVAAEGRATLTLDLRPQKSREAVRDRLRRGRGSESWPTYLRKALNLAGPVPALLREALPPAALAGAEGIADAVKSLPLTVTAPAPLARAISTAGGVQLAALDDRLMLRALPGVFAAGEMLDWEAPTGGYLLQASFASGMVAAEGALAWLRRAAE